LCVSQVRKHIDYNRVEAVWSTGKVVLVIMYFKNKKKYFLFVSFCVLEVLRFETPEPCTCHTGALPLELHPSYLS
jgi:hypothetical protein